MDYSRLSFYKLNEKLLSLVGQWPDRSKRSILFRRILIISILTSSVIIQVGKIYIDQFDINLMLELIPMLSVIITFMLFAFIFYMNSNKFIDLWERLKDDWTYEIYEEETKIKEEYAEIGEFVTKCLLFSITIGSVAIVITILFYAQILDVIQPLNESRTRQLPFNGGYIIDKEKYHYTIIFHLVLVIGCSAVFALANQSMFLVLVQHTCGMFAVLGHQIQNSISHKGDFELKKKSSSVDKESIKLCIKRHQKALEFADVLDEYYSPIFMISLLLSVLFIAPTFYRMSDIKFIDFKAVIQLVLVIGFFFATTLIGQRLIDISESVHDRVEWDSVSVSTQKLIILILKRSEKPCSISAFNLYALSLDCFRMVLQAGLSYYMLLKRISEE